MKKTFLTFLAVGFGVSMAFAQTTPHQDVEQDAQQDVQPQTEHMYAEEPLEQGRNLVEMHELPAAVQETFTSGQYSDLEVLAIYEIRPDQAPEHDEAGDPAAENQTIVYEFELAEIHGREGAEELTEEDIAEGTAEDEGLAGIETQRVSARQPDILLQIDEHGQVVQEIDLDEDEME